MTPRVLGACWIVVAVVFLVLLGVEYAKWSSITTEVARTAAERQRLAGEIQLNEQQLVTEMRKNSGLVQEMQWTSNSGDPSVFLTRLADLAREKRMTVLSVGSLERQTSPQFTKSWHSIQVRAPYQELRDLATRLEQDRGVLEDLRVEPALSGPGQPAASSSGPDEVQARFRLTALELSPQAKMIVERTLAAGGEAAKVTPGSPLALSVPAPKPTPGGRNPFAYLLPPPPPPTPAGQGGTVGPLQDLGLMGIVSFPDGFLAIVNNQIVKVGDTVSGFRVERITDHSVTLTAAGTTPRTIQLPEMAPEAPPRR
jgi:hypothetical protein